MNPVDAQEWFEKARHDLGSAELLLKESDYFDIIVYHSHQCVEKLLKWFLIRHNKTFPFIHDLVQLMVLCEKIQDLSELKRDIAKLNEIMPKTRYPSGENISKEEAQFSFSVAQKVFKMLTEKPLA